MCNRVNSACGMMSGVKSVSSPQAVKDNEKIQFLLSKSPAFPNFGATDL